MADSKIKNKAYLEIEACEEDLVIESNEVVAETIDLKLEKTQSCNYAVVGGKLKYTVKIINQCDTDILNVNFMDIFDDCCEYVAGSFEVDGKKETPTVVDNILEYLLHEIKGDETITITFEVKINEDCCGKKEEEEEEEEG
jgi:uncharacterized repeat protein (TIGR01451 family)